MFFDGNIAFSRFTLSMFFFFVLEKKLVYCYLTFLHYKESAQKVYKLKQKKKQKKEDRQRQTETEKQKERKKERVQNMT